MIETEQAALVRAGIADTWSYVQDISRWATIMPGYRECEISDANNSHWTLKVGVGGLVRTVRVEVHVDEWAGPETVHFSFQLVGDPVHGGGSYRATELGPAETQIALKVQVIGTGPMAPMWEAMGKPLLPQFARNFAEQLRDHIEAAVAPLASSNEAPVQASGAEPPKPEEPGAARVAGWLRALWRKLFG